MSAPDVAGSGESGPYVLAFRGVLPGGMSGFGAEGVAVDEREKWCQASLSFPGAADTAVDAVAILDSGSGITTMSVGITHKLQAAFSDVQVVGGMSHPGKLKVPDGRENMPGAGRAEHQLGFGHPGSVFIRNHAGGRRCCHSRQSNPETAGHVYDILGARARERAALTGVDTAPSPLSTPQRTGSVAE